MAGSGDRDRHREMISVPDLTAVRHAVAELHIELPSWSFGNTGTRFKVF
jgi:L-rhamnose isomerase